MSEIFPQDIENTVLTRLKDNTNGINAQLAIIDTARSQSTPTFLDANISSIETDQNPEIIIDYEDSIIDDYFGEGCDNLKKNCTLTVIAFITDNNQEYLKQYASNYIEAITKCLHKYSIGNITSIFATDDIITDLYTKKIETTKVAGVRFKIKINGGVE